MTAILHRGLRNDFFSNSDLLFPISIWTFISLFSLDFYFPFLFGLLFSFSLWTVTTFLFPFFVWTFIFPFLFGRLFNCGHILDFFQIFIIKFQLFKMFRKWFEAVLFWMRNEVKHFRKEQAGGHDYVEKLRRFGFSHCCPASISSPQPPCCQSFISQVVYVNTWKKTCSAQPFRQMKNGMVSGRFACTLSSRTWNFKKL